MISCGFIKKYHPLYDCIENDESEYKNLVRIVQKEVLKKNKIREETFIRVIRWKSSRTIWRIDRNNFSKYIKNFKKLKDSNNSERLNLLIQLPGIRIPIASVFLNLIWPNKYPIIDVRTIGVLRHYGHIDWSNISEKHYWEFRNEILKIKKKCQKYCLRKIDRALFYFHKKILK